MGYFDEILQAGAQSMSASGPTGKRWTVDEIFKSGQAAQIFGGDVLNQLFSSDALGFNAYGRPGSGPGGDNYRPGRPVWAQSYEGESGPQYTTEPTAEARKALEGYTFDWAPSGTRNEGRLTAFDPTGQSIGDWWQSDTSATQSTLEAAALAAAGFTGLGALGAGPLAGLFGAGAASAAAGGTSAAAVDAAALGQLGLTGAGAGTGAATGGGLLAGVEYGAGAFGGGAASAGAAGSLGLPAYGAGFVESLGVPTLAGSAGAIGGQTGSGAAAGASASGIGGALSSLAGKLGSAEGIGSLASILSGIYGMNLAGDMRDASDPFAAYRGKYAEQLAALEANPSSITQRPGFRAGLDVIDNKSAATGYFGSGNMAAALSRYSGDFFNSEAQRLAGLAGAGQTPGAGQAGAAQLAGQSLGSVGYGLNPLLQALFKGD